MNDLTDSLTSPSLKAKPLGFFRTCVRFILQQMFILLYKVRIRDSAGKVVPTSDGMAAFAGHSRQLIIANHESWLDGILLGLFLPNNPVFVVHTGIVGRPLFKVALSLVDYLKVDTSSPMAMKKVVDLLKSGRPVVIFPEGRLTITGALMKVYDGPAFAAAKSEATVVPVSIDGAGRTLFTRMSGNHPRKAFPRITLTVHEPTKIETQAGLSARERRKQAGESMRIIMQNMMFDSSEKKTLFQSFVDAVETFGPDRPIMADIKQLASPVKTDKADFTLKERCLMALGLGVFVNRMMQDYTYRDLLRMTLGLGRIAAKHTYPGETVGIFLPNTAVTVALTLGVSARGRVPAMLNYKAQAAGVLSACIAADIHTVISSRAFVEKGKLDAEMIALAAQGIQIVYLEDARADFSIWEQLAVLRELRNPRKVEKTGAPTVRYLRACWDGNSPSVLDKPAIVLFTSGTESRPKGVVLSHRAIVSNVAQVRAVFDFNTEDRALNALPIFHSFGLTGGTLLPLFSGIHLVLYATPLHYKVVPELAYDRNSTILFGTNTFLANYGKHANPYDFFRLRYVVAGAEKLTDAVRSLWFEKFGKRIFEGYGATETAPVLSVNTPKAYRKGSVGQFLPGISYALEQVPGIDNGGALHVRGPNVMSGYYRYENPGVLEPTSSDMGPGWYSTGDIVTIVDGFVTIVDRLKRFAKIGGEMVSLSVVEAIAEKAGPGAHAVTTQEDPLKGEALVLYTTNAELTRDLLSQAARAMGHSELSVPRKIVAVAAIPLLGTGKTDYVKLKKMAADA